ncbi:MAG TPA: hypothetical protein VGQ36_23890 [Thermoanaerobaculia bacterium]|nr:hypothetical protein [Thermoanaerobaculia bacterium]
MISFSLATREDDPGIRGLLASTPMPGRIRLRFSFSGYAPNTQVLVARDGTRVVGVACRTIRKLYVNGVAEDIGYLGQLRVDPAYRGQLLTARGYAKMRELHADGRAQGYITTIVDGNSVAEGVLVRRARGAMPRYRFLDKLYTLAVDTRSASTRSAGILPAGPPASSRPESCRLEASGPAAWKAALRSLGSAYNLFPAYEPQGEIVTVDGGSAALNDQRAYKQTVIDSYDTLTTLARPFYNLIARIKLPKPGACLNNAYVTHFCATEASAYALIEALRTRASEKKLDHILLGFTESDPLLRVARTFKPIEYVSSIYTVSWNGDDDLHDRLDSRPRALDISAL